MPRRDVDAVVGFRAGSGEVVSTVRVAPQGKFFTLNGDLDEEELESELCQLFDSLFAEGNQINL
ncbi:MAG: hypothetical protein ACLVK4_12130 [Alistipes shahii]|uniref:hypothetical protein n=1 Tax=Alistipes shahii TaxID=328814 RepID=UPI00399CA9C7